MKRQTLYIESIDWYIYILYDVKQTDTSVVLEELRSMNCNEKAIETTRDVICSGNENIGLTYSSNEYMETIMVIGTATSLSEFLNTAFHECFHVVSHICNCVGIDINSENAAYLIGDIAEQMHPILSTFTCSCCCSCNDEKQKIHEQGRI